MLGTARGISEGVTPAVGLHVGTESASHLGGSQVRPEQSRYVWGTFWVEDPPDGGHGG